MRRKPGTAACLCLLAIATQCLADASGDAALAAPFANLAGTVENARLLMTALRNGSEVQLATVDAGRCEGAEPTRIAPPTGPMSQEEALVALGIAKEMLAAAGISHPTSAELRSALLGGSVMGADGKNLALKGVLRLRADGAGWPQVASASGVPMPP